MRLLTVALLLAACGGDLEDPIPVPADAATEVCGPMPGGCEFTGPDCPSLDAVCGDVCNASASCCTCDAETGTWNELVYDCFCPIDAGQ